MYNFLKITVFSVLFLLFSIFTYARNIYVYFTPSYEALDAVVEQINSAKDYIDVAVYDFTSRPLALALVRAEKRGVKVRVVLDRQANNETNKYTKYIFLKSNGVDVRFAVPHIAWDRKGLMHNKFAVIDDDVVITGSANWTASAFKINDENIIIIHRYDIANVYKKEFNYLWQRSMIR